ncbi:MAG: YbaK/EbsC family protein [Acidimicrobiales bacterium]
MSRSDIATSVERVRRAAGDLGLTIEVVEYPDGTRTAADAAGAVGCDVAQIVKSMIFDADGEIVLALTSGANQVDTDALAALAGVTACRRADPDRVREATGYAIGGVAPIGHPAPVRTWIDPTLLEHDQVWAAAGTPRHVFAVDPAELVTVTDARPADFTA